MHLTVVGGCRFFVFGLFYNACFMLSGSWKGQTVAYSISYNGFIHVSRPLMSEFVEGCQCSKIVYFIICFNEFGERHNSFIVC